MSNGLIPHKPSAATVAGYAGGRRLSWQKIKAEALAAIAFLREMLSPVEEPSDPDLSFMSPRRIVGAGRLLILLFIVGFLGWAVLAPLRSAVMAPGVIVVQTHVKTIQHLEGGIVRDILVNDGQSVHAGQLLIRMDGAQAVSNLESLTDENDALQAQEARLEAQRDGRDTIQFPQDLLKRRGDPKVAQAMQGEQNTFQSQRDSENVRVIAGLKDEQMAVEKQMQLINREIEGVQSLYSKGLATLPRLLALQRQAADLSGQRSQLSEKIAQTQLSTGENQLQVMNLKNQQLSEVVKELRDVQTKRFDVMDKMRAARDVLSRLTIRAPVSGRIVDLAVHNGGAVVNPGSPLMKIVPQKDTLDVDAHIKPEDADRVQAGMRARVYLNAYQSRRLPVILGTVTNVSADRQVDQRTGQAYFTVNVAVDASVLKSYPKAKLMPGLPVDVAFDTGSHTVLDYLIEPVTDVFRNGMKER